MSEGGIAAFLNQAHRNNWQTYLASLRAPARGGWDLCVLTASDARQAEMYRRQLQWRQEAGLLPSHTRFAVVADPPGRRIGSGGATLRVVAQIASGELAGVNLDEARTLIIHSGGDSRRLPHASAVGKLFARLPRVLPDGRASTVFDEFLISLSGLALEAPPGALVASGDVLLIFDPLQLSFLRGGVIGVAAAAPAEMGLRHGVYVGDDTQHAVHAYLHKASLADLERWGALSGDGTVQIDTGMVWFDADSLGRLAALARDPAFPALWEEGSSVGGAGRPGAMNLYADLLLPLAESTSYEGYLADSSDGQNRDAVRQARELIWRVLRGTRFSVERLEPAVFVHFGSTREYWRTVAGDLGLARMCGWERHAASWFSGTGAGAPDAAALVNAYLEQAPQLTSQPVLVTDSCLLGELVCHGAALVAGVQTYGRLDLAPDTAVHQLPVAGGFVTRVYGLDDDPKRAMHESTATFMNRPWQAWLDEVGISPEVIWPDTAPEGRTLWNARLYPVTEDREESLNLSLPLQQPAAAPPGWRERWREATRLSLAESFALADGERLLQESLGIEDRVAARRFCGAIEAERPAVQVKALLGATAAAASRRCHLVAEWLSQAEPVLQLRGYKALAEATGSLAWEEKAFASLAQMLEASLLGRARPCSTPSGVVGAAAGSSVRVQAAARIDFGGGWTDTPPYSIERGGTVLNAAVTLRGAYPIVAEGTWLDEPRLILESRDIGAALEPRCAGELLAYANPADPFALPKAALVLRGIVPAEADPAMPVAELFRHWGRGLRLTTQTSIPRGSGLGTSSIMAGAVLACLSRLMGVEPSLEALFDEVLCLEQMLTTGGGWQDQVGGLTGGIKLVATEPGLPQRLRVEPLRLSSETRMELAGRLLLVYTGQQRLAKNLLRAVMGRWMARDPEMVWILEEIARLARAMKEALESGDLAGFGRLLGEHWQLNKRMDPGCSNPFIDGLFEVMQPYIHGGKLAGAGGGGFAIVVARDAGVTGRLRMALSEAFPATGVTVWDTVVPDIGVLVGVA